MQKMRLRHGFRPGPHCRSSRRSPTRSDPNRLERAGHTYPHKTRHSASLAPQPRWGLPAAPPPIQINYGYTTGRCMVPEIYLFYKSCFLGPTCLCQGYWCRLPDIRGERQWNLISIPSHSHWATRNSHSHWFQILLPFSSRSNRRPLPIPIKNVWFTFIQTIRREGIAE